MIFKVIADWFRRRRREKHERQLLDALRADVEMWYRFGYSAEEIMDGYTTWFNCHKPSKWSIDEHQRFVRNLPSLIRAYNPHDPKKFQAVSVRSRDF